MRRGIIFTAMVQHRIGIIREAKFPPDARVILTPAQAEMIMKKNPSVEIVVQPSHGRCYHDDEFAARGIEVREDLHDRDILIGVKEVPYDLLIPEKTYMFFSHTIKKQPHNKKLMRALLEKKITMIDYECLKNEKGDRVIAFGRWAGIIGTYNGIWTWGERSALFHLKRAKDCVDFAEVEREYKNIHLPPIKIILTGTGRVAKGALELLRTLKIKEVSKEDFLSQNFQEAVFTSLDSADLYERIEGRGFDRTEFHSYPERYKSNFAPYSEVTDLLVNCIFWNPKAPRLFEKDDMRKSNFHIRVIADVACDVNGGIPATIRSTTINEPVFGYDATTESEIAPFIPESIDIMAIDNLPNELPRDASEEFGNRFLESVWDELLSENSRMIDGATICRNGKLNTPYNYLQDYTGQ